MTPPAGAPVIAVALALVLAAAVTTAVVRRPGAEPPVAVVPAPTAPQVPAEVRAALEERVLTPRGRVERLGDADEGLGFLDAEGVLALTGDREPDRAAALRSLDLLGFEHALARGWRAGEKEYVLLVQRLGSAQGASGLVRRLAGRLPGPASRSGAVPAAVAYTERSDGRFERHAAFARGRYVYDLTFSTPSEDQGDRVFERLLARQSAHAARLDP